jgi:hypothetical protein
MKQPGISTLDSLEGSCEIGTTAANTACLCELYGGPIMTFGRGALLWLVGIPLPIILLLALFWR